MSIITIFILFWLGGWIISSGAYLHSSMKRARMAGQPWSPKENLVVLPAILVTWLPSLVVFVYAWVKARSRS